MNYRRSRVYSAPVPKMPPGLLELMEGLSKDVLRNNPTNIYEFCADHMQKLLQIRDNNPLKKVMSLEEKITNAQKIIRQRANQRCENYDKMIAQRQIECKRNQNHDESPVHTQKNTVNIPENEIVSKQVELPDRGDGVNVRELCDETIHERNEDEYVRNLLINNSAIKSQDADDKKTDKHIIVQNVDTLKYAQKKEQNMEELKDTSMLAIEGRTENENNCELTGSNKSIEDTIENIIENQSLKSDVHEIDNFVTSDENQDPTFIKIDDNVHTLEDLKLNELKISLETTQCTEAILKSTTSDSNAVEDTKIMESESKAAQGVERPNEIEGVDKNSSDDSEMLSDKNNEENVLMNDGASHTMDLETAATTIQKVFRSFLFKCKTTSIDESTNVDINLFINDKDVEEDINISNINITKERRGISRMDTVLQTVNEEKSLSLSTDDSSTLSSAATVIQAHIRGFLVRNKLHINKTSSTSLLDSDAVSGASLETDSDQQKGKTILNIHIVPERGHFVSRDESLITSMDLSMDGSPRSLTNLHPLSYDINERRKQLKREDAVQSVSPPSNNSSSKQSEDIDSVRECSVPDTSSDAIKTMDSKRVIETENENHIGGSEIQTAIESEVCETSPRRSMEKVNLNTDEMDVVTPDNVQNLSTDSENKKLMHSSEFHEVVLPTQVSRTDTSVVRGE